MGDTDFLVPQDIQGTKSPVSSGNDVFDVSDNLKIWFRRFSQDIKGLLRKIFVMTVLFYDDICSDNKLQTNLTHSDIQITLTFQ